MVCKNLEKSWNLKYPKAWSVATLSEEQDGRARVEVPPSLSSGRFPLLPPALASVQYPFASIWCGVVIVADLCRTLHQGASAKVVVPMATKRADTQLLPRGSGKSYVIIGESLRQQTVWPIFQGALLKTVHGAGFQHGCRRRCAISYFKCSHDVQGVHTNFGKNRRVGRGPKEKYFEQRNPCPEMHPKGGRANTSLRRRGRQTMWRHAGKAKISGVLAAGRPRHCNQDPNMATGSPTWHPGVQHGDRESNMAIGTPTCDDQDFVMSPNPKQIRHELNERLLTKQTTGDHLVRGRGALDSFRQGDRQANQDWSPCWTPGCHVPVPVATLDSRSPFWAPMRHVGVLAAMLDSRSPCWTPGCHVGLPVTMLGVLVAM